MTTSIKYRAQRVVGFLLLSVLVSGCETVRMKSNDTAARVLLTPLAVAADSVMVGLVASVLGA